MNNQAAHDAGADKKGTCTITYKDAQSAKPMQLYCEKHGYEAELGADFSLSIKNITREQADSIYQKHALHNGVESFGNFVSGARQGVVGIADVAFNNVVTPIVKQGIAGAGDVVSVVTKGVISTTMSAVGSAADAVDKTKKELHADKDFAHGMASIGKLKSSFKNLFGPKTTSSNIKFDEAK